MALIFSHGLEMLCKNMPFAQKYAKWILV